MSKRQGNTITTKEVTDLEKKNFDYKDNHSEYGDDSHLED